MRAANRNPQPAFGHPPAKRERAIGITSLSPFQNLYEGPAPQLFEREACRERFFFRQRAAVHSRIEIVDRPCPVAASSKDVEYERGLSGLLQEVAQTLRGGVEPFQEETKIAA